MTNPEELVISSAIDDQVSCEYPIPPFSFCFMIKNHLLHAIFVCISVELVFGVELVLSDRYVS